MKRKNQGRTNLLISDDFVHIADANLAPELVGRLSIHSGHQTRIVEKSERSLELCQPLFLVILMLTEVASKPSPRFMFLTTSCGVQ